MNTHFQTLLLIDSIETEIFCECLGIKKNSTKRMYGNSFVCPCKLAISITYFIFDNEYAMVNLSKVYQSHLQSEKYSRELEQGQMIRQTEWQENQRDNHFLSILESILKDKFTLIEDANLKKSKLSLNLQKL